jgi:hypothetical protein
MFLSYNIALNSGASAAFVTISTLSTFFVITKSSLSENSNFILHISNVISKHLKKNFDYLQFTHLEKIFHADENLKMTFLIVSYFSNVCTIKKIKKTTFLRSFDKERINNKLYF